MWHDVGKPKPKFLDRLQEEKDRERQSQVVSVTHPKDVDCDEYKEDDTPDNHLLVQPMYQIFSITIDRAELRGSLYPKMYKITSLDDGVSCQIFGLVRVFVQNGKKIDIYNRSKDNPEFVKLGGLLSIRGCPILQLGAIKVAIYLYDLAHDVEIVNEIIEVECDCIDDYDQVLVTLAHGAYGVATIHHSTLQHAVSANIENMVLKQVSDSDSGTDAHARLRGTVSAHFERSYAISTSDVQEYPSLILFDNRETTEYVQFGTPINLLTTCVGVPAFYSLEIRANFEDESGRDVSTNAKLSIMHEGSTEKCGKGSNCEMKLLVKWSSMLNAAPTHPNLHICVSEAEQRLPNIASVNPIVFPCVEVFSITICPDNRDTNVRGSIEIKDSSHTFLVFNDQQSWYNRESLNLKAPLFSFDDEPFKVDISLVDEDERVISKGSFEWDCRDYNNDAPMFHDRFLCSIIQGDIGYAAVHYSIITYAVQANMQVLVSSECDPVSVFRVHGSITAEYGSYDYSCPYNQEYCKSTLFSKPKEDDVPCEIGLARSKYKLPLAKSIIAVPLDDLLIINLSLTIIGPGQKVQELDQVVEFKTDGRSSGLILGDGYQIRVRANWNYLRKYPATIGTGN